MQGSYCDWLEVLPYSRPPSNQRLVQEAGFVKTRGERNVSPLAC